MVYRLLGLLFKFFFVLLFIGYAKHGNLPSLTLTGRFLEKYFGYLLWGQPPLVCNFLLPFSWFVNLAIILWKYSLIIESIQHTYTKMPNAFEVLGIYERETKTMRRQKLSFFFFSFFPFSFFFFPFFFFFFSF